MMSENPYAKRSIRNLAPYTPGEQPAPSAELVKLNTNENPYPPSPRVIEALRLFDPESLRVYSDPVSTTLRERAARFLGVDAERVFAGNGSDELLAMVLRAFVDPGDPVVYPVPTYSLYVTLTRIYGGIPVEIPVPIGAPKVAPILNTEAAVTFLASPNSPDGYESTEKEIRELCERRMGKGVVVVDEAYIDFGDSSRAALVEEYENLIVTQTLSKSFSLAGLRLGIAAVGSALIKPLQIVKDSYNLGSLPQTLGVAALSDPDHMRANARKIVETREWTASELRSRGWKVYPSRANFLFAEPPETEASIVYERLAEQNIFVRYFGSPPLDRGIRVSIGTREQMETFLSALDRMGA